MYIVGTSTCSNVVDEELLSSISNGGIKAFEISFDRYSKYRNFNYKNVSGLANNYGMKIWSLHLPYAPFDEIDPSSNDSEKRKFTFDEFINVIRYGSDIGIDKFIAHPSAEPINDIERCERLKNSADFFDELSEVSNKYGATIALENLPRSCIGRNSEEMKYLLSANDKLRVCFDTNHLLKEPISDFVNEVGSKIITTHISDCDFTDERHWLPGEGKIEWNRLVECLKSVNYKGIWLYEVKNSKFLRHGKVKYSELYNNALEILSDKHKNNDLGEGL